MLSVKIEFCPLDWYSSSPTAISFVQQKCTCVNCFQAIAISSKKSDLDEISSASPSQMT